MSGGKDGRDSLFRRFGVSSFGGEIVRIRFREPERFFLHARTLGVCSDQLVFIEIGLRSRTGYG